MQLTDYAAKTENIFRENKSIPDLWPIAIDFGYSAVKGFSPNKVFCFPNCAIKMNSYNSLMEPSEKDIVLEDSDGIWIIGEKAHEMISSETAHNYENELYARNRYLTPLFKALIKVGLGIAVTGNRYHKYHGETIILQTGLPPEYMEPDDMDMLKESLIGDYDFDLRFGRGSKKHYHFSISSMNVSIIPQPMGSLFSTIMDAQALQSDSDLKILSSNTLVLDPGFKTLDIYDISAGIFHGSQTFESLGMHEIFSRTAAEFKQTYRSSITVSSMQRAIRKGFISAYDKKAMSRKNIDFSDILQKHTDAVCDEAIEKLLSLYNFLQEYDYLIVTGGTGNVWFPRIEKKFSNMDGLIILPANIKDPSLSTTYSNVRGYYLYLVGMLSNRRG